MSVKVSKTQSSIKGFIWMFFGNTFNIFSQLLIVGILARLLTPTEFGIIGIILLFVNFSEIFTKMGIGTALVQIKIITEEHIALGYGLSIILGVLIGVLFYFLAPYIGTFFNLEGLKEPIRFFSIFFPVKSFNSISIALLQRDLKFSSIVKCNTISYLFGYGFTSITLAFLGFGLWSLIYGQLAILIVNTLLLLYFIKPTFSLNISRKTFNEVLRFGTGFTIDTNFNFLAENSDNIIVGKILGASSLGIYSRAFQFLSLPASFFGKLYDKILFPVLSSKQDDTKKLTSFYLFSISFCLLILLPVSLVLLFNAKLLVTVLLGDQWLEVIPPFQILILGFCFRFGTRINKSFLKSLGLVYKGALYQFVFASLMITSCLIGVKFFGLTGVAYGVLFATIINYIQVSYRIQRLLDFDYYYFIKLHLKTFALFSPIFIIIIAINQFGYNSILVVLLVTLLLILPIYILGIRSKYSIFSEYHNVIMLKQLVDNSPKMVKTIALKLRLIK